MAGNGIDPQEYLRLIEEKNRILKRLNQKRHQQQQQVEQREANFSLFFGGANQSSRQQTAVRPVRRQSHDDTPPKPRRTWQPMPPEAVRTNIERGAERSRPVAVARSRSLYAYPPNYDSPPAKHSGSSESLPAVLPPAQRGRRSASVGAYQRMKNDAPVGPLQTAAARRRTDSYSHVPQQAEYIPPQSGGGGLPTGRMPIPPVKPVVARGRKNWERSSVIIRVKNGTGIYVRPLRRESSTESQVASVPNDTEVGNGYRRPSLRSSPTERSSRNHTPTRAAHAAANDTVKLNDRTALTTGNSRYALSDANDDSLSSSSSPASRVDPSESPQPPPALDDAELDDGVELTLRKEDISDLRKSLQHLVDGSPHKEGDRKSSRIQKSASSNSSADADEACALALQTLVNSAKRMDEGQDHPSVTDTAASVAPTRVTSQRSPSVAFPNTNGVAVNYAALRVSVSPQPSQGSPTVAPLSAPHHEAAMPVLTAYAPAPLVSTSMGVRQSGDMAEIAALVEHMRKLDKSKRVHVLRVLEQLERGQVSQISPSVWRSLEKGNSSSHPTDRSTQSHGSVTDGTPPQTFPWDVQPYSSEANDIQHPTHTPTYAQATQFNSYGAPAIAKSPSAPAILVHPSAQLANDAASHQILTTSRSPAGSGISAAAPTMPSPVNKAKLALLKSPKNAVARLSLAATQHSISHSPMHPRTSVSPALGPSNSSPSFAPLDTLTYAATTPTSEPVPVRASEVGPTHLHVSAGGNDHHAPMLAEVVEPLLAHPSYDVQRHDSSSTLTAPQNSATNDVVQVDVADHADANATNGHPESPAARGRVRLPLKIAGIPHSQSESAIDKMTADRTPKPAAPHYIPPNAEETNSPEIITDIRQSPLSRTSGRRSRQRRQLDPVRAPLLDEAAAALRRLRDNTRSHMPLKVFGSSTSLESLSQAKPVIPRAGSKDEWLPVDHLRTDNGGAATHAEGDATENKESNRALAESWDSLRFFELNHRGRLGVSAPEPISTSVVAATVSSVHMGTHNELSHRLVVPENLSGQVTFDNDAQITRGVNLHSNDGRSHAYPLSRQSASSFAGLLDTSLGKSLANGSVLDSDSEDERATDFHSESMLSDYIASANVPVQGHAATPKHATHSPVRDIPSVGTAHSAEPFDIPELPLGTQLVIDIRTTWGDPHYVGLCGLEIYDDSGQLLLLKQHIRQISANPSSINTLRSDKDSKDPRVVSNLLDGVNWTCDDLHMWLTPFTEAQHHLVFVDFVRPIRLAMLRVWNYNKSRTHSFRGARDVTMQMDGNVIFRGEIARAPGTLLEAVDKAEIVLFTNNQQLLAKLQTSADAAMQKPLLASLDSFPGASNSEDHNANKINADESAILERPLTADSMSNTNSILNSLEKRGTAGRPHTSARRRSSPVSRDNFQIDAKDDIGQKVEKGDMAAENAVQPLHRNAVSGMVPNIVEVNDITIRILSTWGDKDFVGLTGIELIDENFAPVPLSITNLQAVPQDLNAVPGHSGDTRTLDKLVDGTNITTDDEHMWLAPFQPSRQFLRVRLQTPARLIGFRIWNYNKTWADTFRGVKIASVSVNGKLEVFPHPVVFRKAPGSEMFDFGQDLWFSTLSAPTTSRNMHHSILYKSLSEIRTAKPSQQSLRLPHLPCGFVFKFVFSSSWGDPHYIGLNGLELYDVNGKLNVFASGPDTNASAIPSSVCELPAMAHDLRTLDRLFDGVNATNKDTHMWLAPLVQAPVANTLFIYFDYPVVLAMIKIWNYQKTVARGVETMQVFLDDALIYHGILRPAPEIFNPGDPDFGQCVLFIDEAVEDPRLRSIVTAEKSAIYTESSLSDQAVQCLNDRRRATGDRSAGKAEQKFPAARPHTGVTAGGNA